ncbi:hypothetical protein COCCADRAFT_83662, partial [Bipolaris zeicola 26-R-13]
KSLTKKEKQEKDSPIPQSPSSSPSPSSHLISTHNSHWIPKPNPTLLYPVPSPPTITTHTPGKASLPPLHHPNQTKTTHYNMHLANPYCSSRSHPRIPSYSGFVGGRTAGAGGCV